MIVITDLAYDKLTLEEKLKFSGIVFGKEFSSKGIVIEYWKNGQRHRDDGPALVWPCPNLKEYWLHNKRVTKESIDFYVDLLTLKGLL